MARINVCISDDRAAARQLMKPTIVRSLAAQRPDFFTFATAGLTLPPALPKRLEGLAVHARPDAAREAAADRAGGVRGRGDPGRPARRGGGGCVRLGRSGITQFMLYPLAVDGRVETTIERFQREVMPQVRRELERI